MAQVHKFIGVCLACLVVMLWGVCSAAAQCTAAGWMPGDPVPGVDGTVYALTVWDPDGPGPRPPVVVAGGYFTVAGGVVANSIAAYDPATGQWSAMGSGVNNYVRALAVLPNGNLIAGGDFTTAGGAAANYIARWDGASWSPL